MGSVGCNVLVPSRAEPLLPLGTCFCPISASVYSRLAFVFRQRGTHPLYCLLPWGCRWRQLRLCLVKLALSSGFDEVPGRPEVFRSGAFCSTANNDAHCGRLPDTAAHSSSHRRSLARLGHGRLLASRGLHRTQGHTFKMDHDLKIPQSWARSGGVEGLGIWHLAHLGGPRSVSCGWLPLLSPPQGHLQRCRKIITHCPKSLRARHTQRLCTEFMKIVPRGTGTALGEGTENESRPPRRVVPGRWVLHVPSPGPSGWQSVFFNLEPMRTSILYRDRVSVTHFHVQCVRALVQHSNQPLPHGYDRTVSTLLTRPCEAELGLVSKPQE